MNQEGEIKIIEEDGEYKAVIVDPDTNLIITSDSSSKDESKLLDSKNIIVNITLTIDGYKIETIISR